MDIVVAKGERHTPLVPWSLGLVCTRRDALRLAQPYWITLFAGLPLFADPPFFYPESMARVNKSRRVGKLYDFKIAKHNFVVDGANLSRVEIWYWPTGTEIMKPARIGTAARVTDPGTHEKWVLRIPPDLLAVEIFATAFDEAGHPVGKKPLPYKGATALYEALYGKK